MNPNATSWGRIFRMLAIAPLVSLALPTLAGAQAIVTTHPVKFELKLVYQDFNSNEAAKIGKDTANEKDVFEACFGEKPTKTQGIFLALDCFNLNNNRIVLANTNPVTIYGDIGSLDFADDFAVVEENGSFALKRIEVPVEVEISCEGIEADASGVATVKFQALPSESEEESIICPNNAVFDISGTGEVFDTEEEESLDVIVNTGSHVNAKNRTAAISVPLVDPND